MEKLAQIGVAGLALMGGNLVRMSSPLPIGPDSPSSRSMARRHPAEKFILK